MVPRPSFWNDRTQDISSYWFNRILKYGFIPAGAYIAVHQISILMRGNEDQINPAYTLAAGYFLIRGIQGAINVRKEKKEGLEQRIE